VRKTEGTDTPVNFAIMALSSSPPRVDELRESRRVVRTPGFSASGGQGFPYALLFFKKGGNKSSFTKNIISHGGRGLNKPTPFKRGWF
jgi:hypothetical protein